MCLTSSLHTLISSSGLALHPHSVFGFHPEETGAALDYEIFWIVSIDRVICDLLRSNEYIELLRRGMIPVLFGDEAKCWMQMGVRRILRRGAHARLFFLFFSLHRLILSPNFSATFTFIDFLGGLCRLGAVQRNTTAHACEAQTPLTTFTDPLKNNSKHLKYLLTEYTAFQWTEFFFPSSSLFYFSLLLFSTHNNTLSKTSDICGGFSQRLVDFISGSKCWSHTWTAVNTPKHEQLIRRIADNCSLPRHSIEPTSDNPTDRRSKNQHCKLAPFTTMSNSLQLSYVHPSYTGDLSVYSTSTGSSNDPQL